MDGVCPILCQNEVAREIRACPLGVCVCVCVCVRERLYESSCYTIP